MRKFLGVVFILIGVVTSIPVLVSWAARTTLLTSGPWKSAFQEARVYQRALDELPIVLLSDPDKSGETLAATPIAAADLAAIVPAVIPVTFLQETVERTLDVAFLLLHGNVQWADASLDISLQDMKHRAPVEVQNVLIKKLQALPNCTEAQLKLYAQRKTLDGVLPPCKPKGVDVRALVSASVPVQNLAADIPEHIDVFAEIRKSASTPKPCAPGKVEAAAYTGEQKSCAAPQDISASIATVQDAVTRAFQYHVVLTILAFLFFVGAWLLFLPQFRTSFRWFGIGLMIAGVTNAGLTLAARTQLNRTFDEPVDQLGKVLVSIFTPVARNVGTQLTDRLFFLSACVLVVGCIALAVSFIWKPIQKK